MSLMHSRWAPRFSSSLAMSHVVFEGIFISRLGSRTVTGVAQGGLAQLALLEHLVYGYLHAGNPVQGVEDTEYVDAAPG